MKINHTIIILETIIVQEKVREEEIIDIIALKIITGKVNHRGKVVNYQSYFIYRLNI